jgi:WD40 repeat protein/class 3 adenylate cyclase
VSLTETPAGILTFLIADVRGYTSFTQAHGDEAAARLADKFAEIANEGVAAHGGEVTELRGDEALAVFSSPRAALRAAVDLQMVFDDETVLEPTLPLRVGIGIDAGEAVPVQGGYRGGALNLAARLCSKAAPGEVLLSHGVALLTRTVDGIELAPAGKAEVKGLAEPVSVFRASAEREQIVAPDGPGERPAALDAVMPMVGRELEIRRLRWLWRLARRGSPTVCAIQGPPGIGKTRLAAELAASAARDGAICRYATFALDSSDATRVFDGDAGSRPVLVVVDDVESASAEQLAATADACARLAGPRLVVLVAEDQGAAPEVLTMLRRLAGTDERIVRPRPLGLEEMVRVAGFYLGDSVDAIPRDLLTGTGGVPRLVHEQVSEWAHAYATRRLGDLATAAASGRSDLRSVESDLAGTVVDLQLVREQATLFGLGPGRHAPEPTESPYQGLASFDVGDASVFFGRERLVAEIVSRLAGTNLLAIVGPSGSGKSSAMRAGLLPALSSGVLPGSDRWTIALLRPGEHPMRSLDRALWSALPRPVVERLGADSDLETVRAELRDDDRVLIAIDQFEEVFTLCRDETEQRRFLAALAAATATSDPRIGVVIAIRADYYGRCAADPTFADLLSKSHVLVGPMSAEEYRRAIVQPALRVGVTVEPDLVDELVSEVIGEPGALPLLSTALVELWGHRDGRIMRRSSYAATGGVHKAVARLADDVYDGFSDDEQTVGRAILLRLAGPGAGDSVVRRRVPLSEFDAESNASVRKVLDALAARRLVTISEGSAEVAHEALLREWPRLQDWLEEDREGRRLRAHLATAAQEWMTRERDEGELYRGARLSAALDWTTHHTSELNEAEREFITASRTASQAELHRQQRQNRRLRGLLVGVVGVLVLALVAGSVALVQRHSAQRAANRALARQLGSEAVSAPRIDQAMLLAREGVLLDNSTDTQGTLLATLLRTPALRGTFTMPIQLRPQRLALSTDGRTLAVTGNDAQVHFFDTVTHTLRTTVAPEWGGVGISAVGPDFVYDSYHPKSNTVTMEFYNATTLRHDRSLSFSKVFLQNPTTPNMPCFPSASGQLFYCAYTVGDPRTDRDIRGYVESWDLRTGAHRFAALPTPGVDIAGSAPGGNLVMATDDSILTVDGTTLRTLHRLPLALGPGVGAMSPDARTVAFQAGAADQEGAPNFSLIDTTTGHRSRPATAHTADIQAVAFDPTGKRVVSVGDDSRVIVWNARTGSLEETLLGHSGRVLSLTFSRDGQTLYTAALDGAIFVWDLGTAARFGHSFAHSSGSDIDTPALAMAPDGQRFAARTGVGRVGLYSVQTLQPTTTITLTGGKDPSVLAWSHSGTLAVSAAGGGVQLWSTSATPALVHSLSRVRGDVTALAFSADGRRLASVSKVEAASPASNAPPTGWLAIWDVANGQRIAEQHLSDVGTAVAWSPDQKAVVAADRSGKVTVVDPSGRVQRTWTSPYNDSVASLAFLPNGQLLTGGYNGIVQRWNVAHAKRIGAGVLTEPAPVASIAVAPDGRHFAVGGGSSGGVKIWNVSTMDQFGATFPGGAGAWTNLAYTPDGDNIVVVYGDNTANLWPVSVSSWMSHACAVAGRNLTKEEWHRFVPGHAYRKTCPALPAA